MVSGPLKKVTKGLFMNVYSISITDFVKNELQTLNYIRGVHSIDFEIMKLTKCRMDDFRVDWKELWERILKEVPETSGTNSKPV